MRQIDQWIVRSLKASPPRAKSLVVTIFGDALAPHQDRTWLQSLIDLLHPFGVNDRSVRSSVFRLVKEGWLTAERHGRRSRYGFTISGRMRFERAHEKVYSPKEHAWNSEWTMVLAPASQIPPMLREILKRELQWQGFRGIASGTFAHPAGDRRAVAEILQRLCLTSRVTTYAAKEADVNGTRTLRNLVVENWELQSITKRYLRFIDRLQTLVEPVLRSTDIELRQAFVIRTLLIHEFRRITLHDPLLPAELLPNNWPARTAYDLCRSIYRRIFLDSERYLSNVLGPSTLDGIPAPFSERFDGLCGPRGIRESRLKLIG